MIKCKLTFMEVLVGINDGGCVGSHVFRLNNLRAVVYSPIAPIIVLSPDIDTSQPK